MIFFCFKKAFIGHKHDHEGHGHDHDAHNEGVYKGLGAIVGIYVFFVIEKIMQMRRARKEKRVILPFTIFIPFLGCHKPKSSLFSIDINSIKNYL